MLTRDPAAGPTSHVRPDHTPTEQRPTNRETGGTLYYSTRPSILRAASEPVPSVQTVTHNRGSFRSFSDRGSKRLVSRYPRPTSQLHTPHLTIADPAMACLCDGPHHPPLHRASPVPNNPALPTARLRPATRKGIGLSTQPRGSLHAAEALLLHTGCMR